MQAKPLPRRASPDPSVKPRIALVGAGSLASALAVALRDAGYFIDCIVASNRAGSLPRARRLAKRVGASTATVARTRLCAEVVWFCVPDSAIAEAAMSLQGAAQWRGKVALHSSGALSSEELAVLRSRGASVASLHPMMTFVRKSRPPLAGVPFAVEGDRKARLQAIRIVGDLQGSCFPIRRQDKPAYHAWGMFASPLITALLATGERVAAAAGVPSAGVRRRVLPMLMQTLANYATLGAASAFSGPLVRGDSVVVQRHLQALRALPEARAVYVALARAAGKYLPGKNAEAIARALQKR
jgi:predicted short-subunit dehydrogenase-like oxidoreductase (DUF2520 family)